VEHAALAHVADTPAVRRAFQSQHGDVQLAMPGVLATPSLHVAPCLSQSAVLQREALESLLPLLAGDGDRARAAALRRIARWSTLPVVAFTQFIATAAAFYSRLHTRPSIAWLSGNTARITSGVISRDEVLERLLSPRYHGRHDAVRLLITTDVLSEGLSLAGVATIVHLDLPWTAARIDQRIGRAARIGAPVARVNVVHLPTPVPAELHAGVRALLRAKRNCMTVVDGADDENVATVRALHQLCAAPAAPEHVAPWITLASPAVSTSLTIATVWIAGRTMLVAVDGSGIRRPTARDWQSLLSAREIAHQTGAVAALRRRLGAWQLERQLTTLVSNPRDKRLRSRREADEALRAGDRMARVARATTATDVRRLMTASARRAAQAPDAQDNAAGHTTPAPVAMLPAARRRAIRILSGVFIVPTP
jgi:Helicase conserved C-terminal domain